MKNYRNFGGENRVGGITSEKVQAIVFNGGWQKSLTDSLNVILHL